MVRKQPGKGLGTGSDNKTSPRPDSNHKDGSPATRKNTSQNKTFPRSDSNHKDSSPATRKSTSQDKVFPNPDSSHKESSPATRKNSSYNDKTSPGSDSSHKDGPPAMRKKTLHEKAYPRPDSSHKNGSPATRKNTSHEKASPRSDSSHKDGSPATRKSTSLNDKIQTGDTTVSSTTSGSKNIFEKLMSGRRSQRKRSKSPRCDQSESGTEECCDTNSEEKQLNIATAVKALRVLSSKVPETNNTRVSRKDKESAKTCRNESPSSSTSPRCSNSPSPKCSNSVSPKVSNSMSPKCSNSTLPRCSNSVSPKRQSPRRLEKMSPPTAAAVQKSPKARKSPSSCVGSDGNDSPIAGRPVRSSRKGEDVVTSANSSSCVASDQDLANSSGKVKEKKNKDDKPGLILQKTAVDSPSAEHTIQILSSTSRGCKVIQVDPQQSSVCTSRQLFVDTQLGAHNSASKPASTSKTHNSDSSEKDGQKLCIGASAVKVSSSSSSISSAPSLSVSPGKSVKKPTVSGSDDSILCAMLVGGNEVTQNYERSRDQIKEQGNKPVSECDDGVDFKPSETSSFLNLNDSFFDDDVSGDVPEDRPYELPVLSQLPALIKPDLSVLDVTKTETPPPDAQPLVVPAAHRSKTSNLLQLIAQVSKRLPEDSEACHVVLSDVHKILSTENHEESKQSEGSDVNSASTQHSECKTSDKEAASSDNTKHNLVLDECSKDSVPCEDSVSTGNVSLPGDVTTERKVKATLKGVIGEDQQVASPGSACSLGDLDTTQMTQAATQAVQHHIGAGDKSRETASPSSIVHKVKTEDSDQVGKTDQAGTAPNPEDAHKPGPSNHPSSSQSQPRSFFSRISSPSRLRWKPKAEPVSSPGRPKWSRWHTVTHPQPIGVLKRFQKQDASQHSAFVSKTLDNYLKEASNRLMMPACKDSRLAKFLLEEGHVHDYDQLQRQISGEEGLEGQEAEVKSEDEEDDDKDSEAARKLDPDFDEVEGLVFVSFPSEMAMKAHLKLEASRQFEGGPTSYLNMAKYHAFELSRRKDGNVRRESQGLRGQHMKWRRYQRLFRQELRSLYDDAEKESPWPLNKLPEKTSDIHKIKNWKNKYGDMKTEDIEALELLGEEEERIRRKRKTYVFSSKKKKLKRPEGGHAFKKESMEDKEEEEENEAEVSFEQQEEEDESYGVPIPIDEDLYMEQVNESIEELRHKEKGLKQSKGIFSRFKMGPEERHIFKKLGGWNSRFRRFRRMPVEMKTGDSRSRPTRKRAPKKDRYRQRFELKFVSMGLAMSAMTALCVDATEEGWRKSGQYPIKKMTVEEIWRNSVVKVEDLGRRSAYGREALTSGSCAKANSKDVVDLTGSESSDVSKKLDCDKPGCRYGCICHLCLPSAEIEECDQPVRRTCDKEYCRMGCICDSLEKSGATISPSGLEGEGVLRGKPVSCGKPGCVEKCVCHPAESSKTGQYKGGRKEPHLLTMRQDTPVTRNTHKSDVTEQTESSSDELPTLEKTTSRRQRSVDRYSNLPRRQTSYRMAKNLDAVSRKAMMMWETSEIYSEQTTSRRKKTSDSQSPAVTTSSPSLPQSTAILSSPHPSPTITTTTTSHHVNLVTTATSVNTLSPMKTSPMGRGGVSPVLRSSSASGVKLSPPVSTPSVSSVSKLTEDNSPVVVSDDEGKLDSVDSPSNPSLQTTRLGKRRKPSFQDEGNETSSDKGPGSTPNCPINLTASPEGSKPSKQQAGSAWNTSLICLKASNPTLPTQSDEVQEEDEIRLVEIAFNCEWSRCREEILQTITGNVQRGCYPDPRIMVIGDFQVEILPKGDRPCAIPVELRSKLPKYMFPVRVRVTQVSAKMRELLPNDSKVARYSLEFSEGRDISRLVSADAKRVRPMKVSSNFGSGQPMSKVPNTAVSAQSSVSVVSSSGPGVDTVTSSSLGISGLGRLQISHSNTFANTISSQGQAITHIKIGKEEGGAGMLEGVGEKKKKKKKKKKSMIVGEDSLVPDLSNLSVSPRKSTSLPLHTATPPLATSTPTLRGPSQPRIPSLKEGVMSPVQPHLGSPSFPVSQSVSRMVRPGTSAVRPQLLGLSNLPVGVKFLQLPGQNNLLQIVPASVLGLKPMDNKNVPNFVAVPVSLTSVAPQNLVSSKKAGKTQSEECSISPQRPHDLSQAGAGDGNTNCDNKLVPGDEPDSLVNPADCQNTEIKKKKKKKKKQSDEDRPVVEGVTTSSPLMSSPLLMASSPSPVLSSGGPYPIHTMGNMQAIHPAFHSVAGSVNPAAFSMKIPDRAVPQLQATSPTPTHPHSLHTINPDLRIPCTSSALEARDVITDITTKTREDCVLRSGTDLGECGKTAANSTYSPFPGPSLQSRVDRTGWPVSTPPGLSGSKTGAGGEGGTAGASDDESRGSWLDNVDLSSDEEGLDVGVEPPAPDDLTSHLTSSRTEEEYLLMRRDNEQRRRDDLKEGFRTLRAVLNTGGTLPKMLSQHKILTKAMSLIQYHQKLALAQEKAYTECHHQQVYLLRQRQRLIEGSSSAALYSLLSQVPSPFTNHPHDTTQPLPFSDPSTLPCPRLPHQDPFTFPTHVSSLPSENSDNQGGVDPIVDRKKTANMNNWLTAFQTACETGVTVYTPVNKGGNCEGASHAHSAEDRTGHNACGDARDTGHHHNPDDTGSGATHNKEHSNQDPLHPSSAAHCGEERGDEVDGSEIDRHVADRGDVHVIPDSPVNQAAVEWERETHTHTSLLTVSDDEDGEEKEEDMGLVISSVTSLHP